MLQQILVYHILDAYQYENYKYKHSSSSASLLCPTLYDTFHSYFRIFDIYADLGLNNTPQYSMLVMIRSLLGH